MNQTQQLIEAEISLGGVSRNVLLSRLAGQATYWCHQPVICRFRSGTKTHTKNWPTVVQRGGRFEIALRQVVANKPAMAIGWAEDLDATSNWLRESTNAI